MASVTAQTWKNLEILLVDNNSDKATAENLARTAASDARITLLYEPRRGVSAARNCALDAAKGEYVCFVDSDDTVSPDYVERMMDPIVHGRAEIGAVIVYNHRSGSRIGTKYRCRTSVKLNRKRMIDKLAGTCCNKIYRKDLLDRFCIRFDERYRTAEDQIFSVEYLVNVRSAELFLESPKYFYRANPFSATSTFSKTSFDPRILDWPKAIERRIWPTLRKAGLMSFSRRASMFWACGRAMVELRTQGRDGSRLYKVLEAKRRQAIPARIWQSICVPGSNPGLRRMAKRFLGETKK